MTFSYYVMFIQNVFIYKRKAYRAFSVGINGSEFVLIMHYLQLKNGGHTDSFMAH